MENETIIKDKLQLIFESKLSQLEQSYLSFKNLKKQIKSEYCQINEIRNKKIN